MGLDMYLHKEIYIGGEFDHREVKGNVDITIRGKKLEIPLNKISTINLTIGYWRKANQIHKWFVDNVQGGNDDCGRYWVDKEQLKELKALCKAVLDNKGLADELLPSQAGFFFGGTEYDDWYFKDLEDTIQIIDDCFKSEEGQEDMWNSFYYSSSW